MGDAQQQIDLVPKSDVPEILGMNCHIRSWHIGEQKARGFGFSGQIRALILCRPIVYPRLLIFQDNGWWEPRVVVSEVVLTAWAENNTPPDRVAMPAILNYISKRIHFHWSPSAGHSRGRAANWRNGGLAKTDGTTDPQKLGGVTTIGCISMVVLCTCVRYITRFCQRMGHDRFHRDAGVLSSRQSPLNWDLWWLTTQHPYSLLARIKGNLDPFTWWYY